MSEQHDQLDYAGGGLPQETNWWGAFVIGLAGTILVTGIAPVMVTYVGAASIPSILIVTLSGWLLCLFLAELSAMMPERVGGSPSYAYPAYKDRWPRLAEHINGFTAWAYWLGWFPVGPLNMIIASGYIVNKIGWNTGSFTPIHTPIAWSTLIISLVGLALMFIPAYLGIRFGAMFATVLGVISMVPLTFVAVGWIFHGGNHWGDFYRFHQFDGTGFFTPLQGHGWFTIYVAFSFLLTWNVIAMEAAACYIGECKDPDRDAKIAMTLEGGYGVFIYALIPISFILVIGEKALNPDSGNWDPRTIFVNFSKAVFGGGGNALDWIVALLLVVALALSALNAITGTARALHQMSVDGQFPRFFQHTNKFGVPDRSMMFNVVCMFAVVFMGGAVEIYTFSNVGYLASFLPVLVGYYLLRKYRPNLRRPFRLPEWMKYAALGLAGFYAFIYFYGGPIYASCPCSVGRNTLIYYFIGLGTLASYLPLYWYRKNVEDKKYAEAGIAEAAPTAGT